MTTFRIVVVEAEGLMAKDKHKNAEPSSDPFVTLRHGKTKYSTSVHARDLSPTWNETFDLDLVESDPVLKVTVWDHDKLRNDFLGKLDIDLSECLDGAMHDRWHILQPKSSRKPVTGRLRLAIQALGLRETHETAGGVGTGNNGNDDSLEFSDDEGGEDDSEDVLAVGPDGRMLVPDADEDGVPDYNIVVVRIKEARDLGSRKYDPYCEVSHGNMLHKTLVVSDNMHPHWNEQFLLDLNYNDDSLVFKVYDSEVIGKDVLLGQVVVPVADYMDGEIHDEWHALQGPPKKSGLSRFAKIPFRSKKVTGELRFEIVCERRDTAILEYERSTWMGDGGPDIYMFEGIYILFLILVVVVLKLMGWTDPLFS